MGMPLRNMLPAETPGSLIKIAQELDRKGATGFLLSGGCNDDGVLPVSRYLSAIRIIKDTTNLKINAHPGFPRSSDAQELVSSGIDVFSVTFPIDDRIGKDFFRIQNALERYDKTFNALHEAGANKIVTHFLIGLATEKEEFDGVRRLEKNPPKNVVILSHTPLKGTPMENQPPTTDDHMISFIKGLHDILPDTKIILGCMRERGRHALEKKLIEDYLDGIVLPSRKALKEISDEIEIVELAGCCALYL